MMEKLNFLKNKWIALGTGVFLALFLFIVQILSWKDSQFSLTGLIVLLVNFAFIGFVVAGIFTKKRSLAILGAAGFLASEALTDFSLFGTMVASFYGTTSVDGAIVAGFVLLAIGTFLLVASLGIIFVEEVKGSLPIFKLVNAFACAAAFLFILVGFILLVAKGMNEVTTIMTFVTLLLVPVVDVVMSINLD